nr:hypothetical protein [Tanacetum cinerariifolium]
ADSGPIFDDEPLQKVSNDDHYNMFTIENVHPEQSKSVHDTYLIEQDAQNVIIDSLDMNYDREEIEQNDDDNDLVKEHEPFDYDKLNNLYDLFVPQREKSSEQHYFSERSRLSHINVNNGNSKEAFNKQTTLLEKRMDESIPLDKKCQSSIEIFKVKTNVNTIITCVELCKQKIANRTYIGYIDPFIQNTIESNFSPVINRINAGLDQFHRCLNEEMVADLRYFNSLELEDLKAQLQDKGIVISELKKLIEKMKGKSVDTNLNAKTLNVNSVSAICDKCMLIDKHDMCVLNFIAKPIQKTVASESNQKPRNSTRKLYERVSKTCSWWYPKFTPSGYKWKPKSGKENVIRMLLVEIVLFIVDSGCSKHTTGNLKLLINFVEKFLRTVKFGNDQIAPILRYGDLVQGAVTIKKVTSINGKRYVLVIVDDYSRYTWTHFLRSKDETPKVLIDFLSLVQRGLQAQVRVVRTDKGTKFLNQTLHAYFAAEGILYKTSVARTPEQNDIVERRNRTLIEADRTMLSAAKVPLFFWAEAIATACLTQNRSLVIPRHEKTPYHIINNRKPSVKFFHTFSSICYIVRDGENLDKMKDKGDECIFVSSDPAPECQSMALEHASLSLAIQRQENVPQAYKTVTTSNELDLLFSLMFDELLNGSSKVVSKSSAVCSADAPNQCQHHSTPLNNHTTPAPTCQVPSLAPTVTSPENISQAETYTENDQVADEEFINIFCTPV